MEEPEQTVPPPVSSRRRLTGPAHPRPSDEGRQDAPADERTSPFPYAVRFDEWVADETAASDGGSIAARRAPATQRRNRAESRGGRDARTCSGQSLPHRQHVPGRSARAFPLVLSLVEKDTSGWINENPAYSRRDQEIDSLRRSPERRSVAASAAVAPGALTASAISRSATSKASIRSTSCAITTVVEEST